MVRNNLAKGKQSQPLQSAGTKSRPKNGSNFASSQQAAKARNSDQIPAVVMHHRDDWMDFRDPNRISSKAGVPFTLLPKVAVKELVDDALDAADGVEFGLLEVGEESITFVVADLGPGLDGTDVQIAELYSIRRSLSSTKMVRMPTRGMLGNGLRVVAGVVLVAGGQLRVSTRGRTLTLRPRLEDGRTEIRCSEPWHGTGTRVEVTLRGDLARHAAADDLFEWATTANNLKNGTRYKGKSSFHWYDESGLWELLQSAGEQRVNVFVAGFDGCSDKTVEIAGDLAGRPCVSIRKDEAVSLLCRGQAATQRVSADRLGKVGRLDDYFGYAYESGEFTSHGAKVPFVIEAWANRSRAPFGVICVNRTPVCADVAVQRKEGAEYAIFGCGLRHLFTAGRKDVGEFRVMVNVITPTVPLTSSGKEPDLTAMVPKILAALEKAIRVAKRTAPKEQKASQKAIVRANIRAAARKLSGGGEFLFSLRQLFYELRPKLIHAIGREPQYGTFSKIVGDFEDQHGDVEQLYRDDRGTLYHPHTGQTMSLGTRSVSEYQRPNFNFRSILFAEKEGLFPMLKHVNWPERFDCALCSSKGFATRAAAALLRLIAEAPEPIDVFVIHDADGPGTVIYEDLKRTLEPHGIDVINLGLEPAEARAMGLTEEPVSRKANKRVPVADYVPDDDKEWLQSHRIELNAMITSQFIDWLSSKFMEHFAGKMHKVIPPAKVLQSHLEQEAKAALERHIVERVMAAANVPAQVEAAYAAVQKDVKAEARSLVKELPTELQNRPSKHWTGIVKDRAASVTAPTSP